jgi:hypothetical protein
MFMKQLDNKGNTLFHSMEHTNNSGVYRLLFDETNTVQVDTLLVTFWEIVTMQMPISDITVMKHRRYQAAGRTVQLLEEALCRIHEDNNPN